MFGRQRFFWVCDDIRSISIYISISCCLPAAAFASNNISLCSRHSLIASLIQPALPQHQKPQVQSIHYCYLLRGTRTVFKRNSVGLGVGKESIRPRNRIHQFNSQFSSVQFSSIRVQSNPSAINHIIIAIARISSERLDRSLQQVSYILPTTSTSTHTYSYKYPTVPLDRIHADFL